MHACVTPMHGKHASQRHISTMQQKQVDRMKDTKIRFHFHTHNLKTDGCAAGGGKWSASQDTTVQYYGRFTLTSSMSVSRIV
jgi:hypothetical protein